MAEEANGSAATRADEIAELKRQMEEMQKRLEQLSNAADDEAVEEAADDEMAAGSSETGEADELAPQEDDAPTGYTGVPAKITIEEEPAIAVEPVPAAADEASAPEEAASSPEPASTYSPEETDEEYTAAAVADFMPQSEPPQPAPPVYGAPSGYAPQPGQPGPYAQQQAQQPPASPYGQQPYAQQPGQTAYYQQNADYYSAPQGGYAQPQGGYQSQYQQPLVRTKDHVAAGLLAIFLGVFGVHKFYLGYNTAGFILLGVTILGGIFTLGIASSVVWLIGIIEGVIYLTKSQPEFEQIYIFNKREWF